MSPKLDIKCGNAFPFDESDAWWNSDNESQRPSLPKDWAHSAARGIIANLQERRGIKHELSRHSIDEELRIEIVAEIAEIIRIAHRQGHK